MANRFSLQSLLGMFGLSFGAPPPADGAKPQLGDPVLFANPNQQTTRTFLRNPSLLVSRKGFRVLHDMRKDDMVKAAMSFKKQCVLVSGYKVEDPEGEAVDNEVTQFVEEVLGKLDGGFRNSMLEVLTAMDFGFSVTEKVYDTDKDGRFVLRRLVTAAPDGIQFETDPYGTLLAIRQTGNAQNKTEDVPLGKFLVWTWDGEFGNWYGRSDLEAAHRPWLIKSQAYNWLGILLERFGIPPVFVHYDQQAVPKPVQDKLKQALEAWQTGAWGMIPRGEKGDSVGFYSPELAGQTGGVFVPALELFDKSISRALLMPGLLGMTPDAQQGSFARANVSFDVFMLVVEHTRSQTEDLINEHIVKPLVDFNFPGVTDYPRFKWLPMADDVKESVMTLWGTLTGQKVVTSTPADEDHIRKQLKFPDLETAQASVPEEGNPNGPQGGDPDPNNPGYDLDGNPLPDPNNPGFDSEGNPLPADGEEEDPDAGDQEEDGQQPPKAKGKVPPAPAKAKPKPPTKLQRQRGARGRFVKVAKFADGTEAPRAMTSHEAKVDFNAIIRDFDTVTAGHLDRMKTTMRAIQDAVEGRVRATYKPQLSYLQQWTVLPKTDALYEDVEAFMREGFDKGRESLRREMPGAKFATQALPMADLDDALAYLRTKSLWVSQVTDEKVLAEVRQVLLQAIANGETLDEVMARLRDVFRPYVENAMDEAGVLLEPARLETIIRTNLTDVYNQGRLVQGAQAEEFLEGWQYSAIIDNRTTEVCQALDGTTFEAGDQRVNSLRPPRHFNCRSVLVPIVVGETIDPATMLTEQGYNEAKQLSGKGFKYEHDHHDPGPHHH